MWAAHLQTFNFPKSSKVEIESATGWVQPPSSRGHGQGSNIGFLGLGFRPLLLCISTLQYLIQKIIGNRNK